MAISNHERVGKAMELLRNGLRPFVEREMHARLGDAWQAEVRETLSDTRLRGGKGDSLQDVAVQLVLMDRHWGAVFRWTLGKAERSLVNELLDVRHRWAHQEPFSGDDADRALDSMARLLTAVSAPQADHVGKMKLELRRLIYDEQVRGEKRKAGGSLIETGATGTLKPWREIVTPHADVASGRYQQAEFAADLWQVHLGEGSDEYKKPAGVLPPHLPHREPEAPARGRRATHLGQGRRSGSAAPDQLRRRQDPLDAGPLPLVLGCERERAGGSRRGARGRRA